MSIHFLNIMKDHYVVCVENKRTLQYSVQKKVGLSSTNEQTLTHVGAVRDLLFSIGNIGVSNSLTGYSNVSSKLLSIQATN